MLMMMGKVRRRRGGTARCGVSAEQMWVAPWDAALGLGMDVAPGRAGSVAVLLCIHRGKRERDDARADRHVRLAELPVHGFHGAPRDLHLFGHLGPHFRLESVIGPPCESVILRSRFSQ